MSEREFLRRWEGSFESLTTLTLFSTQQEGAVLDPLSKHPKAAALVFERLARSPETNARCVAAGLAGRLGAFAPPDALERLFDVERRRSEGAEPLTVVAAQQVVEAIVFAAARWCRDERSASRGLAMCRTVVERTIDHTDGEYWSSAPYAMVTLVRHAAPDAAALLGRFSAWANGPPPEYLTQPTLANERGCARALTAGSPNAVRRVDALIDKVDAVPFPWGEEARSS